MIASSGSIVAAAVAATVNRAALGNGSFDLPFRAVIFPPPNFGETDMRAAKQ